MDQLLRKHIWVVNLLSLAVAAFFLATGTGALLSMLLVSPPRADAAAAAPSPAALRRQAAAEKAQEPRFVERSGQDICVNNVFNYKVRPCAEDMAVETEETEEEEEEVGGGVPPYCGGDCQLVATMASSDAEWAFAMIKSGGKTMPFRVGDAVSGLGKLKRVGWRLVLVDADSGPDCLLDLYPVAGAETAPAPTGGPRVASTDLEPAGPAAAGRGRVSPELQKQIDEGIETVSATERNVDRGLVESLTENSSSLMSQARILPYERDGQVQGFKLYGIRRNSLLGQLGLRNGDIVNSIGGVEMTSPDRALEAYTKLRNASNISVEFTRRGQRQTMEYNIR